ncbi:MAG: 1-acyl-sn-glycerol-3-phosphate acyltransferase [bacterium]|nr:1-acyl-sn-glycerol-3-phosphate acyltransferase [bacterium]
MFTIAVHSSSNLSGASWLVGALVLGGVLAWSARYARSRFPEQAWLFGVLWLLNRMWAVLWYRIRRIGPCTVPARGPVILTANHASTADPLMLYATCPHRSMSFLIAREYAHLPIVHHVTDSARCIPVKRDGQDTAAARQSMRRLLEGGMLGIFIEGRIPEPDQAQTPKDGVALLALMTGATVIPAYISGQVYRRGVAASLFARHRARVRYGPAVDLSKFHLRDRDARAQATAKIYEAILALAPEERPSPDYEAPGRYRS